MSTGYPFQHGVAALEKLLRLGRYNAELIESAEHYQRWTRELFVTLRRTLGEGPELSELTAVLGALDGRTLSRDERKLREYRKEKAAACCHIIEMSIELYKAQAGAAENGEQGSRTVTPRLEQVAGTMIFIGHGRSPVWKDLRDFLKNRLDLPVDEINRVAIAGATTVERLQEMLDSARFAFIVMTAEDEDNEGKLRARQNVVHEVGLFQGRLGFKKAIVLFEDGCDEFSNITGLSQIRFPKGDIGAKFEEIRRVLEREGLIPGTGVSF